MRKRLREKLQNSLFPQDLSSVYNSFDIIGDVAIIKTPNPKNAEIVAHQIMNIHKKLRAVYSQTSAVQGSFRVRELKLLAGENKPEVTYKENGCIFKVNLEKCYFSPRLSFERSRIASLVKSGEVVVNMFAGVGCFSVLIAKTVPDAQVYSIDINPTAFHYMQENIQLNHVSGKITALLGDAKDLIQTQLQGVADRVLMPLPELALQYLPFAVSALKKEGGTIHFHSFEHAAAGEDPVELTKQKVAPQLTRLCVTYQFVGARRVRSTGPNWWQTVLDIEVA
ncbi:MAG: class I SAM-dependent methyltransferase family protein [Candidatus Bathyarchaeota archaeon]|nr:class I SAM-dependent methyltransferase family protein [Candidatus Bathyarchaeota archaeon]